MRCIASKASLWLPKAVSRMNPSPLGPKPTPGVVTNAALLSNLLKNDHEVSPSGIFTHRYGEQTPPKTVKPDSSSDCFMSEAFL